MTTLMGAHLCRMVAGGLCLLAAGMAQAGVLSAELKLALAQHARGENLPVIIQLPDRLDPAPYRLTDRRNRHNALFVALKEKGAKGWQKMSPLLAQYGGQHAVHLWMINAVAVSLPAWAIEELAHNPSIGRISYDGVVLFSAGPAIKAAPTGSWNLDATRVAELWSLGLTGTESVVASLDTGVDGAHPDLASRWRGGTNSWFDPNNQHALPYDFSGHGTQTMGLMVGGASSGTPIGMAPGARWIAAKIFDDNGVASLSKIHLAFQWLLDPDGNPATLDAPDIVNGSWGLAGAAPGSCNTEFAEDIALLKAAGIGVVFAAGNGGPDAGTSTSPASSPGVVSVGMVDPNNTVDPSSSRGPSGCDGGIFPRLVAPGVNVVSSDLSFGGLPLYASVSGTSFSAPHAAGAMALLASAFPSATVAMIETAMVDSARDLGEFGPDSVYGYGLMDVSAARDLLTVRTTGGAPSITSAPPTAAVEGQQYVYAVKAANTDGSVLTYALQSAPAGMNIVPSTGLIKWTPTALQIGQNGVVVRVSSSTELAATQAFTINVIRNNTVPVTIADSYTATSGTTLAVAAPGILANDTDSQGQLLTASLASLPMHGSLALNSNGGFTYTPAAGFSGTDSFAYRASNGVLQSAATSVALAIQPAQAKAPQTLADSYSVPVYRSVPYPSRTFSVLSNDSAGVGALAPGSIEITSAPSRGGTARTNINGTISYTPLYRFTGSESFSYRVRNNFGQWSNIATVMVKIQ